MKEIEIKFPLINQLTITDMLYLYKYDKDFGDSFYISEFNKDYINVKLGFDKNNLKYDIDNFANYIRKNTDIAKKFYLNTKNNLEDLSMESRKEVLIIDSDHPAGEALLEDLLSTNDYSVEKISSSKYRVYGIEETKIPYLDFKEIWNS